MKKIVEANMATREQIDQLSKEQVQAIREAVCADCEADRFFTVSTCRYVCPAFKAAVDEQIAH